MRIQAQVRANRRGLEHSSSGASRCLPKGATSPRLFISAVCVCPKMGTRTHECLRQSADSRLNFWGQCHLAVVERLPEPRLVHHFMKTQVKIPAQRAGLWGRASIRGQSPAPKGGWADPRCLRFLVYLLNRNSSCLCSCFSCHFTYFRIISPSKPTVPTQ